MPPLSLFSRQDYSGWNSLEAHALQIRSWVCGCVGVWVCGYVGVTSTSYKTEPCLKLELQRSNC